MGRFTTRTRCGEVATRESTNGERGFGDPDREDGG